LSVLPVVNTSSITMIRCPTTAVGSTTVRRHTRSPTSHRRCGTGGRTRSRNAVHVLVKAGALPDGTLLRVSPRHGTTEATRAEIGVWLAEDSRRGRGWFAARSAQPLAIAH
jgi:hypothetical protein